MKVSQDKCFNYQRRPLLRGIKNQIAVAHPSLRSIRINLPFHDFDNLARFKRLNQDNKYRLKARGRI